MKNEQLIDNEALRAAIQRFSDFLRADYEKQDDRNEKLFGSPVGYYASQPDEWYPDRPGLNVVRIIHGGSQRTSYCFIVLRDFSKDGKDWWQGDILMAAGWKAPAFNKRRGNVMRDDYGNCTWPGPGYLR